jgi:hypothetical protein
VLEVTEVVVGAVVLALPTRKVVLRVLVVHRTPVAVAITELAMRALALALPTLKVALNVLRCRAAEANTEVAVALALAPLTRKAVVTVLYGRAALENTNLAVNAVALASQIPKLVQLVLKESIKIRLASSVAKIVVLDRIRILRKHRALVCQHALILLKVVIGTSGPRVAK